MWLPDGYCSHYPILSASFLLEPEGNVLELGAGFGSTYLLHELCRIQKRRLVTIENDLGWLKEFQFLESTNHLFWGDLDSEMIDKTEWSIVFIDHIPHNRRGKELFRVANNSKLIILHDTNPDFQDLYNTREILNSFKYRYDFVKFTPFTTVLSNYKQLDFSI